MSSIRLINLDTRRSDSSRARGVRLRKPELAFYLLACRRDGVKPREAVFRLIIGALDHKRDSAGI